MGIVRDSLPPVPEDKEIRAKNRARNEEQKKVKEDKKAKAARKAQRREISAKNHREAEKAGVPPPDSPETLVSKIEGGGDNVHWLDELVAEEDGVIPPVGEGIEIPEGSRARGGSEAPGGSQAQGGGQTVPHIIVDDEDGAPQEGSVLVGPQEGEKASGGESEAPPQPIAPEGLAEPCPMSGAEAGSSVEATQAETTVEAPAPSAGETGVLRETPKELQAPRRNLPPERGAYRISDLSFDFLFFSFF